MLLYRKNLSRIKRWGIEDLIDFEYLLSEDKIRIEKEGDNTIRDRDRAIFLEQIEPATNKSQPPTSAQLCHLWLQARRKQLKYISNAQILPGQGWKESYVAAGYLLLTIGFLIGSPATSYCLSYSGKQPVNVFWYLIAFVGSQVLIFFTLALFSVIRLCKKRDLQGSFLYTRISSLLLRVILYFRKKFTLGPKRSFFSNRELVQQQLLTHGSCLLWPTFVLVQIMAVGFNLGVLITTLFKVVVSDIAFGWQSTLQIGPELVLAIVKIIALPWAWLFPADLPAYPGLADIQGSQLILKEGIQGLSNQALASWWPFLCLSVTFWGLLPRIAFSLYGRRKLRQSLEKLKFDSLQCQQLIQRLTTPTLSTHATQQHGTKKDKSSKSVTSEQLEQAPPQSNEPKGLALIPDDIYDQCPFKELQKQAFRCSATTLSSALKFGGINQNNEELFKEIEATITESKIDNIFILQEAWLPPVGEFFDLAHKIQSRFGNNVPLLLGFVGKPNGHTIFTSVNKRDFKIWQEQLKTHEMDNIRSFEITTCSD